MYYNTVLKKRLSLNDLISMNISINKTSLELYENNSIVILKNTPEPELGDYQYVCETEPQLVSDEGVVPPEYCRVYIVDDMFKESSLNTRSPFDLLGPQLDARPTTVKELKLNYLNNFVKANAKKAIDKALTINEERGFKSELGHNVSCTNESLNAFKTLVTTIGGDSIDLDLGGSFVTVTAVFLEDLIDDILLFRQFGRSVQKSLNNYIDILDSPSAIKSIPSLVFKTNIMTLEESRQAYRSILDNLAISVPSNLEISLENNTQAMMAKYTRAVQKRLDDFARTRGYDNIHSAIGYVNSTVPKYSTEANYAIVIRDNTWSMCYEILADVQQGIRPVPTISELLDMLPTLQWPESTA